MSQPTIRFPCYYSTLTKYPSIFDNCYWGNFTAENAGAVEHLAALLNNRNAFVERNNVVKRVSREDEPEYVKRAYATSLRLDHVELYRDSNKNWLVINSPYGAHSDASVAAFVAAGWTKIDDLYGGGATTFMKVVSYKPDGVTCGMCICSEDAAKDGHLECLKYYHKQDVQGYKGNLWSYNDGYFHIGNYAAQAGAIDCMLYAVNNGCPPTYEMLTECVKRGRVDGMLGLMKPDRPVNFDGDIVRESIEYAKKSGDVEPFKVLVRFLIEHGHPVYNYDRPDDEHKVSLERGRSVDWTYYLAAKYESFECIKVLCELGVPITADVAYFANTVEQLRFAVDHGVRLDVPLNNLDEYELSYAAMFALTGNKELLEYAMSHGCPPDVAAETTPSVQDVVA